MSPRAFVAVLVLLSALVGGSAGTLADLLAPAAHACGETCCCDEAAGLALDEALPGCCAKQVVNGPQLRASCGCGKHEAPATAPVLAQVALPGGSATLATAPPRLAADAPPQDSPRWLPSAPDPPPPRGR